MAWTTPRTWVANEIVTAGKLNTHIRDNLNETIGPLTTSNNSALGVDSEGVLSWSGVSDVIGSAFAVNSKPETMVNTFTTVMEAEFTPSDDWVNYTAVAVGMVSAKSGNASATTQIRVGVEADAAWGGTGVCQWQNSGTFNSMFARHHANKVGEKIFAVQVRFSDAGAASTFDHGMLWVFTYRIN